MSNASILNLNCLCCSGKIFTRCCAQYLDGDQTPKTPEQLMRSRYCAYALGGYGKYLLDSWFPATAQGLTVEQLSEKNVEWTKLEVTSKSQKGDDGTVAFKAHFKDKNNTLSIMEEISEFKRINGKWYYIGKQV